MKKWSLFFVVFGVMIFGKTIAKADISTEKSKKSAQLKRDEILTALEAGGVDNWEWYGESLKEKLDNS